MSVNVETKKKKSYITELLAYNIKETKRNWQLYLFMLPYMLFFVTFVLLPVLLAIYYGFTYFNILEPPKFIGIDNYIRMMLSDDIFLIAFKNTILFAIVLGPLSYILSLGFAWMINELTPKLRAFLTLIFYAPAICNILIVWKIMLHSDQYGFVNAYLAKFGFAHRAWFDDPNTMIPTVLVVLTWMSLSTGFLTLIAGLQGVDRSLYEAAAVDGISNRWQELWYITLPYIKPHLLFAAVMSITNSFGIGPNVEALVGFPSQDYMAHTIMAHMKDFSLYRYEMGYACALATFLFILMIVSNKLAQKFLSKVGG